MVYYHHEHCFFCLFPVQRLSINSQESAPMPPTVTSALSILLFVIAIIIISIIVIIIISIIVIIIISFVIIITVFWSGLHMTKPFSTSILDFAFVIRTQKISWFFDLEICTVSTKSWGADNISSHNGQGLGGDADRICQRPVLPQLAKWRHQWNGTHTSDTTYSGSTFSAKLSEFRIFTLIKLSKKLLFQVEGVFSTF